MTTPLRVPYTRVAVPFPTLRPMLAVHLANAAASLTADALVDSGSDTNVLPWDFGVQLGCDWSRAFPLPPISGTLASIPSQAVLLSVTVGTFPPVTLAFAWVQSNAKGQCWSPACDSPSRADCACARRTVHGWRHPTTRPALPVPPLPQTTRLVRHPPLHPLGKRRPHLRNQRHTPLPLAPHLPPLETMDRGARPRSAANLHQTRRHHPPTTILPTPARVGPSPVAKDA